MTIALKLILYNVSYYICDKYNFNCNSLFDNYNQNNNFAESSSCFPSITKVEVDGGKTIKLSELQIGDRIKTGGGIKKFK